MTHDHPIQITAVVGDDLKDLIGGMGQTRLMDQDGCAGFPLGNGGCCQGAAVTFREGLPDNDFYDKTTANACIADTGFDLINENLRHGIHIHGIDLFRQRKIAVGTGAEDHIDPASG